jgi:hypothetical protein
MGKDRMLHLLLADSPRPPSAHARSRLQVERLEGRAVPSTTSSVQDDFNDNSLNAELWLSGGEVNPLGRTAVLEQNQRIEFIRSGNLATRTAFDPSEPLEVAGIWTWAATGSPVNAHILTRYKADPTSISGVGVTFDPDDGLFLVAYNNGSGSSARRSPSPLILATRTVSSSGMTGGAFPCMPRRWARG